MRVLNKRCRAVGCPVKLWGTPDHDLHREIIQHGPNPEHVIILTLDMQDWSEVVEAWLVRIHPDG